MALLLSSALGKTGFLPRLFFTIIHRSLAIYFPKLWPRREEALPIIAEGREKNNCSRAEHKDGLNPFLDSYVRNHFKASDSSTFLVES